jgi:hypothetical protein
LQGQNQLPKVVNGIKFKDGIEAVAEIKSAAWFTPSPIFLHSSENAFLSAIAVAKQQRTRSFELRAALALAKLYQSTGRAADAHAALAPALEGFAATPEMPEIAEAQTLLSRLT